MNREELKNLAKNFLKTYGWFSKSIPNFSNAVLFSRPTGMGLTDELLVYFHEKGEEERLDTSLVPLATQYERIPGGDNSRRFFLSNVPLGVPPPIAQHGFLYQVPAWFFDREFSSARERTPLINLEEDARKFEKERVPQPFESDGTRGDDLLEQLSNDLTGPKNPSIRIVVAPAGYGKTVLMSSLYTKLKEQFMQAKKEQRMALRPLVMLPGHIKRADDLDRLINNFIGDEYDYGVASAEAFKFWVTQGFAVWLLDGLEELIIKTPEIAYKLLDEYIYAADSRTPQIVISIRKPLLATSPELREAINEWKGSGITLYELSEWGDTQKENYFARNLLPELPVSRLIDQVKTNDTLSNLCSVPYYCSLITELNNENRMRLFNDATDLVEYAFDMICQREFSKGLDEQICPIAKQKELFSILALEHWKPGARVDKDQLRQWAEVAIPHDLADDIKSDQLNCLERHAVLSIAGDNIEFVHDILNQFLIAKALLEELKSNKLAKFNATEIEPASFIYKYLSTKADECNWPEILIELASLKSSPQKEAKEFRNILKIYLSVPVDQKEDQVRALVSNTNLSGLIFKDLNLAEFDFHNSKLGSTEFIDCNLTRADFDGCYFKDTFLSTRCVVTGASVRNAILESIRVENKHIYDQKEIQRFFHERTHVPVIHPYTPCQAAINLRKVFEKFSRKAKGFNIPKNFVAGTKLGGGVQAIAVMNAAIKKGYLTQDDNRVKIKINLYEEVADFVEESSATQGIKEILDAICGDVKIGCKHIVGS